MNEFYDGLDALYQTGDQAAVEAYIRQQLQVIADAAGPDSPEYAAVLNELAGFLRGVSRYAESEDALVRALSIIKTKGAGLLPQYATMLLNLAGLYRLTGRTGDAVSLFLEAKQLFAEAQLTREYAYASVLNNLALAYQDNGDFVAALASAREAYALILALDCGDHEIATSLSNLAAISLRAGNASDAEAYIDEALTVYDRMPEENVHHAAALNTKAALLSRAGRHREALDFYLRASDLTERFFGRNIDFAAVQRHIAVAYAALGDTSAAARHLTTALAVYQSILGQGHTRTRDCEAMLAALTKEATQP